MSSVNKEVQLSSDALPFRQGAKDAAEIRTKLCTHFRILVIGKANAGKTTILRKVCNAKPDAKPIVYDADGKEVNLEVRQKVRQEVTVQHVPTKVPRDSSNLGITNKKTWLIMIVTIVLAV